jgi:hypothetical protein
MYNILGNRAMEGKYQLRTRENQFDHVFVVLANGLLISIEQNQSWQIQESLIQLIGTGSEYIQPDEDQILPRIFSLIPKLNFCNNLIITATLNVLGQYSHWLGNHPDILENCVHLCINALSNLELIQSASIALKELIKENRMHMSKYLNEIFPIMKVIRISITICFFSFKLSVECARECSCSIQRSSSLCIYNRLYSLGTSIENCHRSFQYFTRTGSE